MSQKNPRASLIQIPLKYIRMSGVHWVLIAAAFGFDKEKKKVDNVDKMKRS